ncbi:MAG TPA: hypothetical protein VJT82_06150 [Pyrinomonadaceae bacterium]|nr:hypothetical protein [Pyrinomonadaceae bacterium]
MNPGNNTIFRPEAVRRHMRSKDEPVLPRFGKSQNFMLLWAFVLLFILSGGALCWSAKLPVYVSGYAVAAQARPASEVSNSKPLVVVFFPPEQLPRLRVGERVRLRRSSREATFAGAIIAVEQNVSSPEAARERFGLDACAVPSQSQPSAIAVAEIDQTRDASPAQTQAGSVYRADVEAGTRRFGTLLPVVGFLFDK